MHWLTGYLKRPTSLQFQFFCWIAGVFLFCLVLPVVAKQSLCEAPRKQERAIDRDKGSSEHQYASKEISYSRIAEEQKPEHKKPEANASSQNYLQPIFCDETKLTDWALVFFTACLVVVGWFTIKSAERSSRNADRAHVSCTPFIENETGVNRTIQFKVRNVGRTFATLKEIYMQSSATEPSGRIPVYKGSENKTINATLEPTPANKPGILPFHYYVPRDCLFISGYIDYEDMFGQGHTTRFCVKLVVGDAGVLLAGPKTWSDWN